MRTCPHCKLISPQDVIRCDCGYDFLSGEMKGSYIESKVFQGGMTTSKIIAVILAAGGTFWGVFCLPILIGAWTHSVTLDLSLLAGYLITVGYFILCRLKLSLPARRAIWIFSALIQGGWLFFYLYGSIVRGTPITEWIIVVWWAFALVASLIALILERCEPDTKQDKVS